MQFRLSAPIFSLRQIPAVISYLERPTEVDAALFDADPKGVAAAGRIIEVDHRVDFAIGIVATVKVTVRVADDHGWIRFGAVLCGFGDVVEAQQPRPVCRVIHAKGGVLRRKADTAAAQRGYVNVPTPAQADDVRLGGVKRRLKVTIPFFGIAVGIQMHGCVLGCGCRWHWLVRVRWLVDDRRRNHGRRDGGGRLDDWHIVADTAL